MGNRVSICIPSGFYETKPIRVEKKTAQVLGQAKQFHYCNFPYNHIFSESFSGHLQCEAQMLPNKFIYHAQISS